MFRSTLVRSLGAIVLFLSFFVAPQARAQTWTTIPISFYPGTMVLMTDGTVLVHYVIEDPSDNLWPSGIWEQLTPDEYGNYADGTWSQLPTMPAGYAPHFHATAVLPDGRLLVEGGEYNGESSTQVETNQGAIYDPVANSWTSVSPPSGFNEIGDAQSVVLPNGTLMLGGCCAGEALFNASNLSWTQTGNDKADSESEEGWVLLPNSKVLTVDLWASDGTTSELYDPGTGTWSASGTIPVPLEYSACEETGPMVLRPDGTVTAIGGNGQLATYAPATGTWSAGPLIGGGLGAGDGPAALLPDGNVFFQVSESLPGNCYGGGSYFFEWDGTNLIEEPPPPDDPGDAPSYEGRMLVLPTGQILYDDAYFVENQDNGKNLYLYTPTGTYQSAWQPKITTVGAVVYTNTDNQPIYGQQFNGLSQGAMYGDDEQMAENFPLVYIENLSTGHVFYCRTHDFNTMAVATGSAQNFAEFDVPGDVETGPSDLVVVANGIPSSPVQVTVEAGPPPSVTVSPASISMRSRNGGDGSGSATLTNNGPGVLAINSVWVTGDYFSLTDTSCSSSLGENSSCYADVSFSPGSYCIGGTAYGTLYFSDSAGQQTVSLTGTQQGCIQAPVGAARPATPAPRASLPLPPKQAAGKGKSSGGDR